MEEKQDLSFEKIEEDYISSKCSDTEMEITVLTGVGMGGSVKIPSENFYRFSFKSAACIEKGKVRKKELRFLYIAETADGNEKFAVRELTPYTVKCRQVSDIKNSYYVLAVTEREDLHDFDGIIGEMEKPVVVHCGDNTLAFDNKSEVFKGVVKVGGKTISVTLEPEYEEDNPVALESLDTLSAFLGDFENYYRTALTRLAEELVAEANGWKDEGDEHEITEEEFIKRIDKNKFSLYIDGTSYSLYLDDDDIFMGHTLVYDAEIDSDEYDAYFEG